MAWETTPGTYRQSLIATFDSCPLRAKFAMEDVRRSPSPIAARGSLIHRFIHKAVKSMKATGQRSFPVEMGMELLTEVLCQRDVPSEEVLPITMEEMQWCRAIVVKFCESERIDARRVLAAEQRFFADLPLPIGETVKITGQLDLLVVSGRDELTVRDYKAQPLDAKVLTPIGWKSIGELWIGDEVIGSDGLPTRIRYVYPQGRKEVYEVEFTDGSRTRCCDDHLWTFVSGSRTYTKPLREIRGKPKGMRFPSVVSPIRFREGPDDLSLDPYLLGALLGDGNLRTSSSVRYSSGDPELFEAVSALLPEDVILKPDGNPTGAVLVSRYGRGRPSRGNSLRTALRDLGLLGKLAWEKSVPKSYLYASPEARLAILQGLMDTDGHIATSGKIGFRTSSPQLCQDVLFLARSLGGRAAWCTWDYPDKYRRRYSVQMRLPVCPFRLKRKADRWRPSRCTMDRYIRTVRPVGVEECVCIQVEAENGLYLTDDLIVTHNSGYRRPTKPRNEEKAEREGSALTPLGWVQREIYSYLMFENFRSVHRVNFEEVHLLRGEERRATRERWEMEKVKDVLASQVSLLHQALQEGPESARWTPTAGPHCSLCAKPRECPILEDEKLIIDTPKGRQRVAQEWVVAGQVREKRREILDGLVDVYGPIPVVTADGNMVVGWDIDENGKKNFGMFKLKHVPESAYDRALEDEVRKAGVFAE